VHVYRISFIALVSSTSDSCIANYQIQKFKFFLPLGIKKFRNFLFQEHKHRKQIGNFLLPLGGIMKRRFGENFGFIDNSPDCEGFRSKKQKPEYPALEM